MDSVQKFIEENQHQLGYIMQQASRRWIQNDPIGALTVGPCNAQLKAYGDYFSLVDKVKQLENEKSKEETYVWLDVIQGDLEKDLAPDQKIEAIKKVKQLIREKITGFAE
ncbi:hypothetical protein ABWK22_02390 [Gottfriedia acidiceleris]|uniref:hypothetical protein n=1 Tax=Gottfriedia acidiceleris TaxID=371036 RepID=UPI003390AFDA